MSGTWGFGFDSLTRADSMTSGDMLVGWKTANSEWEFFPANVLLAYIQDNLVFPNSYTTQYASPSATAFSVSIDAGTDGQNDIHLILTPTGAFADGEIVLPLASTCRDGQRVQVNCTQDVTTLAFDANGATAITGEPASITANDFFTLAFDLPSLTWYRVG